MRKAKPWLLRLAVAAAAIGVISVLPTSLCPASETPSIEFITAALNSQLQTAAIDVDFSQTDSGSPVVGSFRYVRTKDIQFMSREEKGNRGFCVFDRKRGIGKQFVLENGQKQGWVKSDTSNMPFELAGWPDPVLCLLHIGNLVDVIGEGTVSDTMEKIDGHDCWRVEIKRIKPALTQKYVVWLDPSIGFCPRRAETSWEGHQQVCTLTDYKDIGKGVWFPMLVRWESPDLGQMTVTEAKVTRAAAVTDLKALKVETSFPSGTKVEDDPMNANYTVP